MDLIELIMESQKHNSTVTQHTYIQIYFSFFKFKRIPIILSDCTFVALDHSTKRRSKNTPADKFVLVMVNDASTQPTSPKKKKKSTEQHHEYKENKFEEDTIRNSRSSMDSPISSFWLFLSVPFILALAFGAINLYLNWEHHYRRISDLFDAEELFEGVDFVNLTLLPGGQNDFHPEYPDHLRKDALNMKAVVTSCHMLEYTGGENPMEDRPRHVRSASGLIWTHHDQLAVLQDDVNFLALVDMKELDSKYLSHFRSLNFSLANRKILSIASYVKILK
jgi:hypothetical protein